MQLTKRVILFILAIFFISALSKNIFEYRKNMAFYRQNRDEYESEKKRNIELKTLLVKTNDIHEFEKDVRNKLNLHKSNEYILVIPEPTPTSIAPNPTTIPNHIKWLQVFLKN
ncbi:hypothetical protein A3A93_03980 [Candidatus Roizmanbacteria bacterium RIFCSPLOWO2_01_FULL_38_12]|uniref:Cell division protein FtsL n=1 Tax=Candidatus Roizmanbacteria bacterium RIFCSPLOWO2_01_FULL_38_12 TaxID=1802061 RepID=A0A1F7ITU2_9BACT|nr:MAG: hypothetical protein A3A93_03980 [Candidatus Roizmanbacteria bacterium RIFCSPLOWO2_01_FULL_38_12]